MNLTALGAGNAVSTHGNDASQIGLNVAFYTAGLDYFVRLNGGPATNAPLGSVATTPLVNSFWDAWGFGAINATLRANDADPTDGLKAGNLNFDLIGAGQNVAGLFVAQHNITAGTDDVTTDGAPGLGEAGLNADMLAGLSANVVYDDSGSANLVGPTLFPGGDFSAKVVAGNQIEHAGADLMGLAAKAGQLTVGNGNFTASFALVSGAEDQLYDPTASSDIRAFIVASTNVAAGAIIDAGDSKGAFGATTGGGLGGVSGRATGSFYGGIHAGAGTDLDITAVADNANRGDMNATIRTVEDLDVSAKGIWAEFDMASANIEVGYGINGGNLLGNVIAEGTINKIEVYGNIGSPAAPSLIYTGEVVTNLWVGNPSAVATLAHTVRINDEFYNSTFGDIDGDVFEGGLAGGASPVIYVGGSVNGNVALGVYGGIDRLRLQQNGGLVDYQFVEGSGAFFITGPNVDIVAQGAPDTLLGGNGIDLQVMAAGPDTGIHQLIAGDTLKRLHVVNGSVGQIIVNDNMDITSVIDGFTGRFAVVPSSFEFLINSVPTVTPLELAFNNDKPAVNAKLINVEYNIGITAPDTSLIASSAISIGQGFDAAKDNYAIFIQGNLLDGGSITSEAGSVGNILIGDGLGTNTSINAGISTTYGTPGQHSIGDVYITDGPVRLTNSFNAPDGSLGVVSTRSDITVNSITTGSLVANIDVLNDIGGFVSREGTLSTPEGGEVHVAGSIGLLQASGLVSGNYFAETGSIGLGTSSTLAINSNAGILSEIADVNVVLVAGLNIGNVSALTGDVEGTYTAGGNVGNFFAFGGIFVTVTSGGNVGTMNAKTDEIDATVEAFGSIGNLDASTDIEGSFTSQIGNIGNLTADVGMITADLIARGNIGTIQATVGDISASIQAGAQIGAITAGGQIVETTIQGGTVADVTATNNIASTTITSTGSVGNITSITGAITTSLVDDVAVGVVVDAKVNIGNIAASGNIEGSFTAETGNIGTIISDAGDITGSFAAGASIGDITATIGEIDGSADAKVGIGNLRASSDIEGSFTAETGSIGNILSDAGDIFASFVAGASIGNIAATTGEINVDTYADAKVNIGNLSASGDIEGYFTAETGNIGSIISDAGWITGDFVAGGNIGDVIARTGNIEGYVTGVALSANGTVVTITFSAGASSDSKAPSAPIINFTGSGPAEITATTVSGQITAGGSIASIQAYGDVGDYTITAGTTIGNITTTTGGVGAADPFAVHLSFGSSAISVPSIDIDLAVTALTITAGTTVGNITSAANIGTASPLDLTVNGIQLHEKNMMSVHAGTSIGNIQASGDIFGKFVAEGTLNANGNTLTGGTIGFVVAKTGNIGSATDPVVIRAGGNATIDPNTLLMTTTAGGGVGNIYSFLGDIYLDLATGGDVGIVGTTVTGGIAAPLGSINGSIKIGGNLGGLSGQAINLGTNVVLGVTGVYRNPAGGVARITDTLPLVVRVANHTYTVAVQNVSNGWAHYHIDGSQLVFDSLSIDRNPAQSVNANISITGESKGSSDTGSTTANVLVEQLTINGHTGNVDINGDVEKMQVNGNLRDGEVTISGHLGTLNVTRDIGRFGNPTNMSITIGDGYDAIKVGGTNFGLRKFNLSAGSYISIPNTARGVRDSDMTHENDTYVNLYLGAGTATVTVNNGIIESVLLGANAANLLAITTQNPDNLTSDTFVVHNKVVLKAGAKPTATQKKLIAIDKAYAAKTSTVATVADDSDTAFINHIVTKGSVATLKNVRIEGSVGDITLGSGSILQGVFIGADAGRIAAGNTIKTVIVHGNVGTIAAKAGSAIRVDGSVDKVNVTALSALHVDGNVGSMTGTSVSGAYIGGSAITINAATLKNVQVIGSVGLEVTGAAMGGLTLGQAFSAADAARILGTTQAGLPGMGDSGPNGDRFVGGIDAGKLATNVSVGGLISELGFRSTGNDMSWMLGQVVDDAVIGVRTDAVWVKQDGVITKFAPGQTAITGPADEIIAQGANTGSNAGSNTGGSSSTGGGSIGTIGH